MELEFIIVLTAPIPRDGSPICTPMRSATRASVARVRNDFVAASAIALIATIILYSVT